MLLTLSGRYLQPIGERSSRPFIGRLHDLSSTRSIDPQSEILLLGEADDFDGSAYRAVLVRSGTITSSVTDAYRLGREFHYLRPGDIVRIDPVRRSLTTLYRRESRSNSLLVTERCDNFCVMCSQPPKQGDDSSLAEDLLTAIPLMSPETGELGLTGGEPTLLGEKFLELVESANRHLPRTALHVLSNGRAFSRAGLAQGLARIGHQDLMIGVPLYSDLPEEHDYVVQARGAFDETVRGILNLKRYGVKVEIRFVIHQDTVERMVAFARFVARNLLFVDHVAMMGLELTGFARANAERLWIDPIDYQRELKEATTILSRAGMVVSIYNHQLCTLPQELHCFARASISDWKNEFADECRRCTARSACGGFFATSSARRSRGIAALE